MVAGLSLSIAEVNVIVSLLPDLDALTEELEYSISPSFKLRTLLLSVKVVEYVPVLESYFNSTVSAEDMLVEVKLGIQCH